MIYAGLIHFNNNVSDLEHKIQTKLGLYTDSTPSVITTESIMLSYTKKSALHDMDEVWQNESSIIIGKVFNKNQNSSLKKTDFKDLAYLDKEKVLKNLWGKYVYIYNNKQLSQFEIVVDPIGQLPFFYYLLPNKNILFSSDIEIIFKILDISYGYNWNYLCSYLAYGSSAATQTPFEKIFELPSSYCLKITKNSISMEPFWHPWNFYNTTTPQFRDTVSALKASLAHGIDQYKNIYVSLSGGVDSSSILYCLKDITKDTQNLKALNYFHSQLQSSNELEQARKVAYENRIELIEIEASTSLPFDLPHRKSLLNPNKPFSGLISLRWFENIFDNISLDCASILINGHGGDHIFMCPPSKKLVADYIIENGLNGSLELLKNVTQFYRNPLFYGIKENVFSLLMYFISKRLHKRNSYNIPDKFPKWFKKDLQQKAFLTKYRYQ